MVDLEHDHIVQKGQVDPSSYEVEEEAGSIAHVPAGGEPSPPCRERAFGTGIATVGEGNNRRWVTETEMVYLHHASDVVKLVGKSRRDQGRD